MNIASIKPELSPEIEFFPFDDKTYLLQQSSFNHQLRISERTYEILRLIDGQRDINSILFNFLKFRCNCYYLNL